MIVLRFSYKLSLLFIEKLDPIVAYSLSNSYFNLVYKSTKSTLYYNGFYWYAL